MVRNIINKIALAGCAAAALTATSCDDFLTITPTSQIVEEDFWKDKGDIENVVSACYTRLTHEDMIKKFLQWGEMRSDNFTLNTGTSWEDMKNLMNANLQPTNSMFSWTPLYNEINFCNKILNHGPEVLKADESFTNGDWLPIKAEAVTLRAFSHFYLTRAFGEVPYVTEDYNNDSQVFLKAQSTQEQVLDSIITDLEAVKDYAMKDYGDDAYNKGHVTRKMVYTLLADVYLWRASKNASADSVAVYGTQSEDDYRKCVEYCDAVIDMMVSERKEDLNKSLVGGVGSDFTYEDLLITNDPTSQSRYQSGTLTGAYAQIFGTGNSRESIFELQFDGTNNANTTFNGTSAYFYDIKNEKTGSIVCTEGLFQNNAASPSDMETGVFTKTDYRRWETIRYSSEEQTVYPVAKYTYLTLSQYNGTAGTGMLSDNSSSVSVNITDIRATPSAANWIVYRLSDVLLMKAEALTQLSADNATIDTDPSGNLQAAVSLVRSIFKRSNPYAYATSNTTAKNDSLQYDGTSTKEYVEKLVMTERQREFVAEGKRWFDLVRYAQRKGETGDMVDTYLGRKFTSNRKAVKTKLSSIYSLFSPVYSSELTRNTLLHQNSVWKTSETTSKTDEI